MIKRDYYDILGISRTATPELIRAAHRVQSRRYHPDTADDGKGDAQLFAEIQEAYEVLSSPDNRRRYDTKEGFARGEFSAGGKRRPPKSPCGACGEPVYASQLKLYLGRHMCRECFERKRERDMNRPRLTNMGETIWKLKRISIWVQSHIALFVVIVIAIIAVGFRLAMVGSHPHRSNSTPDDAPLTTSSDAVPPSSSIAIPCPVPDAPASQTADTRTPQTSEKP